MAVCWVICGAGKGVGKTRLARRLCRLLPRSVYAKQGHGRRRPGGPANFFRDPADLGAFVAAMSPRRAHVVVESNVWAREGRGDVVIFLDGRRGVTDVRPDAARLRARARIRVGPARDEASWERALHSVVPSPRLRREILRALAGQAGFIRGRREARVS